MEAELCLNFLNQVCALHILQLQFAINISRSVLCGWLIFLVVFFAPRSCSLLFALPLLLFWSLGSVFLFFALLALFTHVFYVFPCFWGVLCAPCCRCPCFLCSLLTFAFFVLLAFLTHMVCSFSWHSYSLNSWSASGFGAPALSALVHPHHHAVWV